MKRARCYRRGPRLFLHTVSRSASGAWVMSGVFVGAEMKDTEIFLGEALASVLAASREGARDAGEAMRRQILGKVRAKSWTTFLRGTLLCDVERDDHGVRFFPPRSAFRRNFVASDTPTVILDAAVLPAELGTALKTAFRSVETRRRTVRRKRPD